MLLTSRLTDIVTGGPEKKLSRKGSSVFNYNLFVEKIGKGLGTATREEAGDWWQRHR